MDEWPFAGLYTCAYQIYNQRTIRYKAVEHYSVKKLAALAGVSVRTLHLYDQMGLLKPSHTYQLFSCFMLNNVTWAATATHLPFLLTYKSE